MAGRIHSDGRMAPLRKGRSAAGNFNVPGVPLGVWNRVPEDSVSILEAADGIQGIIKGTVREALEKEIGRKTNFGNIYPNAEMSSNKR